MLAFGWSRAQEDSDKLPWAEECGRRVINTVSRDEWAAPCTGLRGELRPQHPAETLGLLLIRLPGRWYSARTHSLVLSFLARGRERGGEGGGEGDGEGGVAPLMDIQFLVSDIH